MTMACVNHPTVSVGLVRCRRCGQTFCRNCVVALRAQYYCARCKADQVRDIQSGTEAGVLELASIGRRFAAQWVDTFVVLLLVLPLLFAVGMAIGLSAGTAGKPAVELASVLGMVVAAAIVFAYEGLMLASRGQTLGKMAVGIKVVTPEGRDVSAGQAWGRALTRQVFFSYLAFVNYLPALFTKQKTAIHDMAAKTRVVRHRR
jgi:uncharacterized RDD family membrane protein YckC